ncbi:MAG: ribonuclease P protein component 4 [Candidatus Aenigmatarchaeota archaeon]
MVSTKKIRRSKKPKWQQRIAMERVERLFSLADEEFGKKPERSNNYVALARKIAMRYNVRIPPELKRRFCKSCHKYLKPGINSRVRTSPKQRAVIVTCLECGKIMRHPYRKEKKMRRLAAVKSQK